MHAFVSLRASRRDSMRCSRKSRAPASGTPSSGRRTSTPPGRRSSTSARLGKALSATDLRLPGLGGDLGATPAALERSCKPPFRRRHSSRAPTFCSRPRGSRHSRSYAGTECDWRLKMKWTASPDDVLRQIGSDSTCSAQPWTRPRFSRPATIPSRRRTRLLLWHSTCTCETVVASATPPRRRSTREPSTGGSVPIPAALGRSARWDL